MKKIKIIVLILFSQVTFGQKLQKIDSLITALSKNGQFNGNILIAEKGKIVFNKSFGLANQETKAKFNENTIFYIGSLTKAFTAMSIVILKEQGKLNFDDKIDKFIPELSFYHMISIKNLLHHTSGLPEYEELIDAHFDKSKIATNKDLINILAQYQPKVYFEPNSKYEYSNTGYILLATIIEKITKMPYKEYLKKAIFSPLRMSNTLVYNRRFAPENMKNYALGYEYSDSLKDYVLPDFLKETKYVTWLDGIDGCGNVNSTVIDLLKWDRALYTTQLVSRKSLEEIFTSGILNDGTLTNYGYGWELSNNATFGKITSHGGQYPGYGSYFERHTDNDKTIIMFKNFLKSGSPRIGGRLKYALYNLPINTD